MGFDVYISSGGPGSPHEGDGVWDKQFFQWMDDVWNWNHEDDRAPKQVFFICHSFQMACIHFGIGEVCLRHKPSFGIFPTEKTPAGRAEGLFEGLPDRYYVADFREWQVIQPNHKRMQSLGAAILALEKERPHVPLERAIMAIRFSEDIVGTQFHPEADVAGMLHHFTDSERRKKIIASHSEEKYLQMIDHLHDPDKIGLTQRIILPLFLSKALRKVHHARRHIVPA